MTLTGLHVLLTYGCTFECDHCFVWSSPRQSATFTIERLDGVLGQAKALGTVEWLYFEGGEPFLYHALLRWGVRRAAALGFQVGVVSNAYWATSERDAAECLSDLAGRVRSLEMSCDEYHGQAEQEARVGRARAAAARLGIPTDVIRIAQPGHAGVPRTPDQLPPGESRLMFRGRAAEVLARTAPHHPAAQFGECPYEDLREPGRLHVDPHGHVHLCQGITLGNVFETPLAEILRRYEPDAHPIAGPLLAGGPAGLAKRHGCDLHGGWADACHLCYATRKALLPRFPDVLAPGDMYGAEA
jgi:MoaA/NifB/PqqE/SkfB family radical SAM enzyme